MGTSSSNGPKFPPWSWHPWASEVCAEPQGSCGPAGLGVGVKPGDRSRWQAQKAHRAEMGTMCLQGRALN